MNKNNSDNRLLNQLIKNRHLIVILIFIIIIITNIVCKNKVFGFEDIITILGFICVLFIIILSKKYSHNK
ncbi:hypothetical protein ABID96_001572 [Bacillus sp. OAE603]